MKSAFVFFVVTLFLSIGLASATTVYISPSSIKDPSLNPGDTFKVGINIKDVNDLYAYDIRLRYDPSYIDATNTEISFLNEPIQEIKNEINHDTGDVWLAVTSQNPAGPKSGSGTLATITFRVKGKGTSSLELYHSELPNTEAMLIEHSVRNGVFDNTGVGLSKQLNSVIVSLIFLILIIALYFIFLKGKRKKSR